MAAIVAGSGDAIIGRTLEGVITSWNPAAEKLFGYTTEEIIGEPIEFLTSPDRAGEAGQVLARITNGQPIEHLDTNLVRKDATVVPVSFTVSPVRDEIGAVTGASVIARHMTEQIRAATATRMAAAIEFSGEASFVITLEGVNTSWTPAAARMFGYTASASPTRFLCQKVEPVRSTTSWPESGSASESGTMRLSGPERTERRSQSP
jgi:PAS domain S-box-containing protein